MNVQHSEASVLLDHTHIGMRPGGHKRPVHPMTTPNKPENMREKFIQQQNGVQQQEINTVTCS